MIVNNFDWIKDKERWVISNNDIALSNIKEIAKPYSDLNIIKSDKKKSIIYVPVHNIHDIYEWYRLFFNSHIIGHPDYTTNKDKFGFWIHGYFDKESSQSIKTYFPNLKLVKTASTSSFIYVDDTKYSSDFIDINATFPTFNLDGVDILDGEYVLLKDQIKYIANKNTVQSFNDFTITINYYGGIENEYKIGSTLTYINIDGIYKNVIIKSISNDGLIVNITVDTLLDNPVYCWDKFNNPYITDVANEGLENGIYQYKDKLLTRISEMDDEFKVYNQVVYCYQGKTNQNKEYYLRRLNNKFIPHTIIPNPYYSKFPTVTAGQPFIYSEGEAYLVKFEFDYNLDINQPEHPVGNGLFISDNTESAYRMLFLDQDIASKIMISDTHGIGTYQPITLNISSGFYKDNIISIQGVAYFTIDFKLYSPTSYNTLNVLGSKIEKEIYENYPLDGNGNNGTHYINPLESQISNPIENYTIYDFSGLLSVVNTSYTYENDRITPPVFSTLNLTNDNTPGGLEHTTEVFISSTTPNLWGYWLQMYNYAVFRYLISGGTEDGTQTLIDGAYIPKGIFIKMKIEYDKGSGYYTALDETFLITRNDFIQDIIVLVGDPNITQNANDFKFRIYPKLSDNFINEFNNYTNDPLRTDVKYKISFDLVQSMDVASINLLDFNNRSHALLLEQTLSKFELDKIYELEINPAINYEVNDAIVIDIPNLIVTDAILAATPTGINNPNPLTFTIGDLLMIHSQTNALENGIYIYQGPNKKLIRSNILFTESTVFQSNCSFSSGSTQFLYNPVFTPTPTTEFPEYGITNITFIPISTGDLSTDISIIKPRQEYHNKYSLYSTTLANNNNGTPISIDYVSDWEYQNNIGLNPVNLKAIYGPNYSVNNYLENYLGITSNVQGNQEIDYVGFPQISTSYLNTENDINRVGFEQNKIILGSSFKNEILRIHKNILFTIDYPAYTIVDILILDIKWIESLQIVVIETNYMFDSTINNAYSDPNQLDPITITFEIDKNNVQTNHFNITQNISSFRPDTAGYAYYLMNGQNSKGTLLPNTFISETATGIWYKENSEPRVSFSKRDKFYNFNQIEEYNNIPDNPYNVDVATTGPINVNVAPAVIDGYTPNNGEIILVRLNTILTENTVYIYNGPGVPMTGFFLVSSIIYFYAINGTINGNQYFQKQGRKYLLINPIKKRLLSDPRLYLRPIEIAKLGVDNDTQPWQKVSYKYDITEIEPNKVNIQVGINERKRIRFVDGLTEFNILNNINNQGQYDWILNDNVELEDAIVGCTQINGPGTGDLIWYNGTWFSGTWVNGIWISGTWVNGTWLNGTWHSYAIQDYWFYVEYTPIEILGPSTWQSGTWTNGTWNHGLWKLGVWNDGIWNDGIWNDGTWNSGIWNNGYFQDGTWNSGNFNNGYFEAGTWNSGIFDRIDGSKESIFGYNSTLSKRAIWIKGIFKDGEIWAGQDNTFSVPTASLVDHRATILFSVNIKTCKFRSGTVVACLWEDGIFYNGVWIGGYYASFITNNNTNSKKLLINPNQYFNALGITNTSHNMHILGISGYFTFAHLTSANYVTQGANATFWKEACLPMFEENNPLGLQYQLSTLDTAFVNDSTHINLMYSTSGDCLSPLPIYTIDNQTTGELDGSPFIASIWLDGTWKNGTWANGYAYTGTFEQGQFLRGYIDNAITFGVDTEL